MEPQFMSPTKPSPETEGRPISSSANHSTLCMPRGFLHLYEVSITPDKCPEKINREIIDTMVTSFPKIFGQQRPVFDGRKNLYTKDELSIGREKFDLEVTLNGDGEDRVFRVSIKWTSQVSSNALNSALDGDSRTIPFDATQALDIGQSNLIKGLLRNNLVKFGEFTLKSGQLSNFYIDLRELTHHLDLTNMVLELISDILLNNISLDDKQPVGIVGVPYGVVPLAGYVALTSKIPYYPIRKEVKGYGNKTDFTAPDNMQFVIIEDVMSSGSSIIETIKKMPADRITDVVVIVDRELGGKERLATEFPNIKLHSIVKASDIMGFFKEMSNNQISQ